MTKKLNKVYLTFSLDYYSNVNKDKKLKILGELCLEVYSHLGGLNFDEKDFQIALGYEFSKKAIGKVL